MTDDEVLNALEQMPETCSLRVASKGERNVVEVARFMGVGESKGYRELSEARTRFLARFGQSVEGLLDRLRMVA